MNTESLVSFLEVNKIKFVKNYPTSNLSSLEIGGLSKLAIFPQSIKELCSVAIHCFETGVKFDIIGNGTNVFFSDTEYDGVIISTKSVNKVVTRENSIFAECGALITDCAVIAMKHGLSGMEFLCGIPGSVGGAVTMNASAYEKSVSEITMKSSLLNLREKSIKTIDFCEHKFDKKRSLFSEDKNLILLSSEFILQVSDKNQIYLKMFEISKKRIISQPLNLPSCGSAFKRPENSYASKLIDSANLKGFTIGGAQISKKHAGFLVNIGGATAKDVLSLISYTKNKISNSFNISLEEEILLLK